MIFHSIQDMHDRYYWQGLGRKVTLSGHQIFYIDEGRSDEVILVLHGFPTSSFDFKDVLRTLKQKYRVIIPDHLGFGFSDKPHGDYGYSLGEQAQKIVELCQVLKLVKINVIENVFTTDQKREMIAKVTDAMVAIEGEAMRGVTWVIVEEVKEGDWGIGGQGLTSADVHQIQSSAA